MAIKRGARALFGLILAVLVTAPAARADSPIGAPKAAKKDGSAADLAAARSLFEKNLQAIRDQDKDAYLACYLESEGLVRTGPTGFELGYAGVAKTAGQQWPDHLDAEDIHLTPIRPGLVYGTYRYRVRYGAREVSGLSERLFTSTPKGWKIAASTAFAAEPGVPPAPRALVGATLLDGNGGAPVSDAVVVLRDGKIDCAGPRATCPVPAGVDVVDLKGSWITPGVIDAHVHFSQTGWADGRPDSMDVRQEHPYEKVVDEQAHHPERVGRTDLCAGVTSVFDVGGYAWTLALPAQAEDDLTMPRIAAAGPLISTFDPPQLGLPGEKQMLLVDTPEAVRTGVRYLKARGSMAVKMWYIVQRPKTAADLAPLAQAAGDEATKQGLRLIVHATALAEAKEALKAGAKLLVHSVMDQPVDDEFLALAKKNGAIYCPTLTVYGGYQRMFEGTVKKQAPAIDDPNGCVDPATRAKVASTAQQKPPLAEDALKTVAARNAERDRVTAENLKKVAAAGIPIAMGTDAGNPLTLHGPSVYAEMETMQKDGLTPQQVLVASTKVAAEAMGRGKELGTIEKGKLADLLVLGADPAADIANLRKLKFVVRGGAMRSIQELAKLAQGALTP
jgi:imidazolonepropionase-like amidohydrolase